MRNSKNRERAKTLKDFPNIFDEWDYSKNNMTDPSIVGSRSHKKFWWKCKKGHSWEQKVDVRCNPKHQGCPICSGKRISPDYNFETLYPKLALEWHKTKNSPQKPSDFPPKSNYKFWWACPLGHEYQATIASRADGRNCPFCSGKKVDSSNSLKAYSKLISDEWDIDKNKPLTPDNITPASSKKVWWKCKKGHSWQAFVYQRKSGSGCPVCSGRTATEETSIKSTHPELCTEWHPTKNKDLIPEKFGAGSGFKAWWLCTNGHEWQATINSRASQNTSCPKCSRQTSSPDLRIYSELQTIWVDAELRKKFTGKELDISIQSISAGIEYDGNFYHKDRIKKDKEKQKQLETLGWIVFRLREAPLEKITENDVIIGSKLTKSHLNELVLLLTKLETRPKVRQLAKKYVKATEFVSEKLYLEYLSYYPRPIPEKSLSQTHPKLSSEWHPDLNAPTEPSQFTFGSSFKPWWLCNCGHVFKTSIAHRAIDGTGCPKCNGKIASEENNAANSPLLVAQFNEEKNEGIKLSKLLPHSHKKLWWKCEKGHEWRASVSKRTNGNGCPYCSGKKACYDNTLLAKYPIIAHEWHPNLNMPLQPNEVTAGSTKIVWWKCKHGHEWKTSVARRTKKKSTCPKCNEKVFQTQRSLLAKFPEIASEVSANQNPELNLSTLSAYSHQKIWWRCQVGHEWESSVANRTRKKTGCPYCSGHLATPENCLEALFPELLLEWDFEKNKELEPSKLKPGSSKVVWWKCKDGHNYQKRIEFRTRGASGCPVCKKN